MTRAEWKALGDYVRDTADRIGLSEWQFSLPHVPLGDDSNYVANCECAWARKHATITFRGDFRDAPPDEQRETVVHELLHCHHEPMWRMVQRDLDEPLGKVAYYVFCDAYRWHMEVMVDALAVRIARLLPPIEWPVKKGGKK